MTKADWRRIILAFSVLAVLWSVGAFVAASNYQSIRDDEERLEELSINVTASLCLQAFAPEEGSPDEKDLVIRYVEGDPIPLDNEICRAAVAEARRQIEGLDPD